VYEFPLGIGLALVDLAVEAGAKAIIISDLRLSDEAADLVKKHENVLFQQGDVCKWRDLQGIIDASETKLGDAPDVYVANAGVFEPVSHLSICPEANF